jgi:hypothetical protein
VIAVRQRARTQLMMVVGMATPVAFPTGKRLAIAFI